MQLPGGHLEYNESLLRCAERETLEETNLPVRALRVVAVTNDLFEEQGTHYVTVFVKCDLQDPTAQPEVRIAPFTFSHSGVIVCREELTHAGDTAIGDGAGKVCWLVVDELGGAAEW